MKISAGEELLVCAACGMEDDWEWEEVMVRVTGQQNGVMQQITVANCHCGHQQEV